MDNIYSSQHKPVEGVPQQTLSVETVPDEEMNGADGELKRVKEGCAGSKITGEATKVAGYAPVMTESHPA